VVTAVLRQLVEAEHYGEPTFGYAGILTEVELPNGGGMLETTAAFYTDPEGERLNRSIRLEVAHRLGHLSFLGADDDEDLVLDGALDLILEPPGELTQL